MGPGVQRRRGSPLPPQGRHRGGGDQAGQVDRRLQVGRMAGEFKNGVKLTHSILTAKQFFSVIIWIAVSPFIFDKPCDLHFNYKT